MLLRDYPDAVTSEERRVRQQLKALLEAAAAQQAESSASLQHSERGRARAPSAHSPNLLPPGIRITGKGEGRRRQQSRAGSGPIATPGTPSSRVDGLGASTTTATTTTATMTTVAATTTTEGVDDATIATTIVTAAGHRTRGARELLARASGMRGSLRISGL
jgi:hypothetical protein